MEISKRTRDKVLRCISDILYEQSNPLLKPDHPRLLELKLQDMEEVLGKLEDMGLVDIQWTGEGIYNMGLTPAGNVYFERTSDERGRFWFRSIWVPIMISFVTTLLTVGLAWLFTIYLPSVM